MHRLDPHEELKTWSCKSESEGTATREKSKFWEGNPIFIAERLEMKKGSDESKGKEFAKAKEPMSSKQKREREREREMENALESTRGQDTQRSSAAIARVKAQPSSTERPTEGLSSGSEAG